MKQLADDKDRNRLYRKNEETIRAAILELYAEDPGRLKAKSVMKKTGLSRQTIYKHFPELVRAPFLVEQRIMKEYDVWLDKQRPILEKIISDTNQRLFYMLMLFMAKNSKCFCVIACNHNKAIIHKMVRRIYPELETEWMSHGAPQVDIDDAKADIYMSICVGIICQWARTTGCDKDLADGYVRKLQQISREAYLRCR